MKKSVIAAALMVTSTCLCAATVDEIVKDRGNGRYDFGWTGSGGGNLEAYSKTPSGPYAGRDGQFKFIFGGGPTLGSVAFTHYNGTGWDDKVRIQPNGDIITKGAVKSTEIVVATQADIWPDYVFRPGYDLMSIDDLSKHIQEKGHLPGIPTADEIAEQGQNLGLISTKTLEKVEELALYVIQLKNDNDALRAELEQIRTQLNEKR